jgi:hypothetical protein
MLLAISRKRLSARWSAATHSGCAPSANFSSAKYFSAGENRFTRSITSSLLRLAIVPPRLPLHCTTLIGHSQPYGGIELCFIYIVVEGILIAIVVPFSSVESNAIVPPTIFTLSVMLSLQIHPASGEESLHFPIA